MNKAILMGRLARDPELRQTRIDTEVNTSSKGLIFKRC